MTSPSEHLDEFLQKVESRRARVGVVGLGYVGLPLAVAFCRAGFRVTGFDTDDRKPEMLTAGKSYLRHIPAESFERFIKEGQFVPTSDFDGARECDALVICVPTPLREGREPDTSYIENTARTLGCRLAPGKLVSLESTTYPGTTEDLLRPILERESGLEAGKDFFLVYSPERE
ncbi:MAG: nucleotide sugar dehydrogenase, partial [Deltaproteobacteria bacterium]